jgi:hypothetical protein
LRAADAQGHPGGVEAVMAELERRLGPDTVHPDTAQLYRALTRRLPPR